MKHFFCAAALASLLSLAACGDDSSSNPTQGDNPATPGDTKSEGPCSFTKTDDVWKYTYVSWKYTVIYTWVDETTVKYEEYLNSYHMDKSDSTMTDQNRDELFETVMEDCLYFTDENNM